MLMYIIMPFASYQPYINKSADVMPPEIFIGRRYEREKIESPTGVNLVYGGRQLGKTALLRMAKKDIDKNENGDRAIIVEAREKDYCATAKAVSEALVDEKILKEKDISEDWNALARSIKNRLRDESQPISYLLLMIDEADSFIESCDAVNYQPFLHGGTLKRLEHKDIQYYYEHMDQMIATIKAPINKYTAFQKKIAGTIQKIGGEGRIHGCIIDIDSVNHVYVNPIDLKLTGYWALNMKLKIAYPNIPFLLKEQCPQIYANYQKLIEGKRANPLMSKQKQTELTMLPQLYLDTDIRWHSIVTSESGRGTGACCSEYFFEISSVCVQL